MSSLYVPEVNVVAFLLAAALERYQANFDQLAASWSDRNRWQEVNHQLREIKKLGAALPQLAVDEMDLVIRHVELLRSLLRKPSIELEPALAEELSIKQHRLRDAIGTMRTKCLRLLTREQ